MFKVGERVCAYTPATGRKVMARVIKVDRVALEFVYSVRELTCFVAYEVLELIMLLYAKFCTVCFHGYVLFRFVLSASRFFQFVCQQHRCVDVSKCGGQNKTNFVVTTCRTLPLYMSTTGVIFGLVQELHE